MGARMKCLQDRLDSSASSGEHIQNLFGKLEPDAKKWLQHLEDVKHNIEKLSNVLCNRDAKEDGEQAVKDLKKYVHRIAEYLKHPPGPHDMKTMAALMQGTNHRKRKKKGNEEGEGYGFDDFMQTQALKEFWGTLVSEEMKNLKHAIIKDNKTGTEQADQYKAHDACDTVIAKINEILVWANAQMEAYQAFVEILADPEHPMPLVTFSSRGLQHHGDDNDDDEDGDGDGDGDADEQIGNACTRLLAKFRAKVSS